MAAAFLLLVASTASAYVYGDGVRPRARTRLRGAETAWTDCREAASPRFRVKSDQALRGVPLPEAGAPLDAVELALAAGTAATPWLRLMENGRNLTSIDLMMTHDGAQIVSMLDQIIAARPVTDMVMMRAQAYEDSRSPIELARSLADYKYAMSLADASLIDWKKEKLVIARKVRQIEEKLRAEGDGGVARVAGRVGLPGNGASRFRGGHCAADKGSRIRWRACVHRGARHPGGRHRRYRRRRRRSLALHHRL